MHPRYGLDTHDMVTAPTIWSCTTRYTVVVSTTCFCLPRHSHVPHDICGTHDMVRPCRVVHITMSCGTCTHDMVMFHTTWSCSTRHDHVVWNIHDVPHDMIQITHGMLPRQGFAPHDKVLHHTVCPHGMGVVVWKFDHTVCTPCRV